MHAGPLRPLDLRSRGRDLFLRLRRSLGSGRRARCRACRARPDPRRRGGLVEKGVVMKRKLSLLAAMTLLALAVSVGVTMASPPSGVTPTILARGTYDAFKVK